MSRTITKKDSMPGLWLPAGKIGTIWYFWIKDVHRTASNMESAEFMMRKDSPTKDIIRRYIGGGGHIVVHVSRVVNIEGTNSRFNPWIQTCYWVDKEGMCASGNCANAILSNAITVTRIYSTIVDFMNIIIYVLEKGFVVKKSIIR